MDIAHLEAGTLAIQAARSKGRQAALMRQHGERVRLIDDLRQFASTEEILDRCRDALGIDERARRHVLLIADRHALLHGTAQLQETLTQLVGCQLIDGAQAAITQMIDIVHGAGAVAKLQDVADCVEEVDSPQGHFGFRNILIELAVDAESADLAQTIAVGVLELFFEELLRLFQLGRISRTEPLVDTKQCFFVRVGRVFLE